MTAFALNYNRTPGALDDALANRKAQPGAAGVPRTRSVFAVQNRSKTCGRFSGAIPPVSSTRSMRFSPAVLLYVYPHLVAFETVLNRVHQEVT